MARDLENRGAAGIRRSQARKPRGPLAQDGRYVRKALGVVDRGGFAEQAGVCRGRRLETRLARVAFERIYQRLFFPAVVGAGAEKHRRIESHSAASKIIA